MGNPNQMDFGGIDWVARGYYVAGSPGASPTQVIDSSGNLLAQKPVLLASVLGATTTLTAAQSGSLIVLDRAAGITITLPSPDTGVYFDFLVATSVTSNAYKLSTTAQGAVFFTGGYVNVDTDTANAVAVFTGDGATHDNLSMNGTTTGGLIGTRLRVTSISSTLWLVEGQVNGNGAVATAFATT